MNLKTNADIFGDGRRRKTCDYFDSEELNNYTMEEMKCMVRTSRKIPEELKEIVAVEIAQRAPLDEKFSPSEQEFLKGIFGGKRWAIRKDDFRLLEIIAATAIAATTFATAIVASPAVVAITLIFAALTLADRLRRKGASLNDKQYEVIVVLKAVGPASSVELAEKVSGLHIYGEGVWNEEKMIRVLNNLRSVHLGDGSIEALVTQAADGLWAVNGI